MRYEDRIVAFIDILGFKSMIGETVDSKDNDIFAKIDKIYEAYSAIEKNWADNDVEKSKKITIFSDSIVISVLSSEKSQIYLTLLEIKHLIMSLISKEILIRGAIVRGKLIHEEKKIFGPALIEAYVLENKAALYPRIILDRDLVMSAGEARASHHSAKDEIKYVESLLEQDSDGMYYLDYFSKAQSEFDEPDYDFPQYIENLGNIIRHGLMGSVHPSRAAERVKYFWMRERYNQMIDKMNLGLSTFNENEDVREFYRSLKKISPQRSRQNLN